MNKSILIFLVAVLAIGGGVYLLQSKSGNTAPAETTKQVPSITYEPSVTVEPSAAASVSATITGSSMQDKNKLIIEDLKVGSGAEAVSGKAITVNYRGTLTNGTEFDSSYKRNQPFSFVLGTGRVIQGWDQGFAGMKVGGKRKLTIPPELGYGSVDMGAIPPNSTLIFEVELLKVE